MAFFFYFFLTLFIDRLKEKESMRAFVILFDYIQAFPRHAYKYLVNYITLICVLLSN